jgi:fatty acid synthase subunit beta
MPFGGYLFANRAMVARTALSSSLIEDHIVAASGMDDAAWRGSYAALNGGILRVRSELSEPIHKIATCIVKLWNEVDDVVIGVQGIVVGLLD